MLASVKGAGSVICRSSLSYRCLNILITYSSESRAGVPEDDHERAQTSWFTKKGPKSVHLSNIYRSFLRFNIVILRREEKHVHYHVALKLS